MLNKIDELRLLAQNTHASILGITESWLDESVPDSEISIDNFSLVRKDRNRNGGGVALYIKNSLAFNVRSDLMPDNLECVMAEVLLPKTKPRLGGVCDRPPDQYGFFEELKHV